MELVIEVEEAGRGFVAYFEGKELLRSRTPFYDAARELLARGNHPDWQLCMVSRGDSAVRMKGVLGVISRYTVQELSAGGIRRVKWRPFEIIREQDEAA